WHALRHTSSAAARMIFSGDFFRDKGNISLVVGRASFERANDRRQAFKRASGCAGHRSRWVAHLLKWVAHLNEVGALAQEAPPKTYAFTKSYGFGEASCRFATHLV